jgi:hypothetical protein
MSGLGWFLTFAAVVFYLLLVFVGWPTDKGPKKETE